MRLRRWNATAEVQEQSGRMFVCGNRMAEGNVAQVLQSITECVVAGVAALPQAVAFGKLFWRECRKSEQIIGSVLDHAYAQVVAGEDPEVRTMPIS